MSFLIPKPLYFIYFSHSIIGTDLQRSHGNPVYLWSVYEISTTFFNWYLCNIGKITCIIKYQWLKQYVSLYLNLLLLSLPDFFYNFIYLLIIISIQDCDLKLSLLQIPRKPLWLHFSPIHTIILERLLIILIVLIKYLSVRECHILMCCNIGWWWYPWEFWGL